MNGKIEVNIVGAIKGTPEQVLKKLNQLTKWVCEYKGGTQYYVTGGVRMTISSDTNDDTKTKSTVEHY